MRISRGLLPVLALSAFSACLGGEHSPPHPTALMVTHQGKPHLVVAVEKEDPVIEVDGKRKRLRGNIPLTTERMPGYAPASATFGAVTISGLEIVEAMSEAEVSQVSPRSTVAGFVEFSATITPQEYLADCFVALVAFDKEFLADPTRRPNAQIRIRELPPLKAGQAHAVKFSTSPFLGRTKMAVFPILFSGGREVRTNAVHGAEPYFHQRERAVHAAILTRWLEENREASRPAQPILQIPPLLDSTEGLPKDATAMLSIAADGTVSEVALDREFPPEASAILTNTLHAWLFLPKIQNGTPVPAKVKLPLRF